MSINRRRKRRSINQISEETSYKVLREKLPKEWVIHEYGPDYGIDCVVELFDFIDNTGEVAETLGEIFYVQLKSLSNPSYAKIKVYPRVNVEKSALKEDKSEYYEIDVIKFQMEVSELLTIQAMGPAIPVLLVVVDINSDRAFFVCLNDYIDKIILPHDPHFHEKDSRVLYIPLQNELTQLENDLIALRTYGKRSKLYGAFAKFHYQANEIGYLIHPDNCYKETTRNDILNILNTFVTTALNQDIWYGKEFWAAISLSFQELKEVEGALGQGISQVEFPRFIHHCYWTWHRLGNLSNMYEELVREWYMPTFLAVLTSSFWNE